MKAQPCYFSFSIYFTGFGKIDILNDFCNRALIFMGWPEWNMLGTRQENLEGECLQ